MSMMESEFFSPLFPNPVSCFLAIVSQFYQELISRYPSDGIVTWIKESWEWHYLAFYFGLSEVFHIVCIATGLTILRINLNNFIFKPIPKYFKIVQQDAEKFPESAWKCLVYTVTWVWALYLCCFSEERYFFKLHNHWQDFTLGMAVPDGIYWLYMLQMGFYVHCVYASLYLETIRRDFLAMMFHHFLTLGLLSYSYAVRYHAIGLLVLFIQDIGDVALEVSKTILYFKTRNGVEHALPKLLADIGFAFFTIQWILFRLYWSLTKVIYSSAYVSMKVYPNGPFYLSFNVMLMVLYMLQVYWFSFIVKLLVKLARGGVVEDTREFEEDEAKKSN